MYLRIHAPKLQGLPNLFMCIIQAVVKVNYFGQVLHLQHEK